MFWKNSCKHLKNLQGDICSVTACFIYMRVVCFPKCLTKLWKQVSFVFRVKRPSFFNVIVRFHGIPQGHYKIFWFSVNTRQPLTLFAKSFIISFHRVLITPTEGGGSLCRFLLRTQGGRERQHILREEFESISVEC